MVISEVWKNGQSLTRAFVWANEKSNGVCVDGIEEVSIATKRAATRRAVRFSSTNAWKRRDKLSTCRSSNSDQSTSPWRMIVTFVLLYQTLARRVYLPRSCDIMRRRQGSALASRRRCIGMKGKHPDA